MKRNLRTLLVAATAGAMLTMAAGAMAQAPGGGPGAGGPRGGMGGGFNATPDRAGTIQRFGLDDAALKLSDAQKAQIDKAADDYVAAMKTVNEKFPMAQGTPPGQEAMTARTKARDDLTAAVNKVLNDDQRKTWEAAQQRRGGGGPGAGGPGGPGGPGGMRGPGGPGGPGGPPGGARPPGQ